MIAAAGALLKHLQAYLVFLIQYLLTDSISLLLIIAVDIMEKVATYALASSYHTIYMAKVIGELLQILLCRIIALSRFLQID